MNDQTDLKRALSRLSQMLPEQACVASQERLLAAFRAQRRRRSRQVWGYRAGAAACLVLALSWFLVHHSFQASHATRAKDTFYSATSGFVALPYAQSDVPLEQAVIVRVELQPSELAAFGVAVASGSGSGQIKADVLVGQDGIARAMRLVE